MQLTALRLALPVWRPTMVNRPPPRLGPDSIPLRFRKGPAALFLTSEYLIKWIDDNKVVDVMLGAGSHEQIIKR